MKRFAKACFERIDAKDLRRGYHWIAWDDWEDEQGTLGAVAIEMFKWTHNPFETDGDMTFFAYVDEDCSSEKEYRKGTEYSQRTIREVSFKRKNALIAMHYSDRYQVRVLKEEHTPKK